MKKLMIAMAVVAMGFAAQANQVKWSLSNVTPSSTEEGAKATMGYTAYLFVASDTSGTLSSYIQTLGSVTDALGSGDTSILSKAISSANPSSILSSGNASFPTTTVQVKSGEAMVDANVPTGNTITGFMIIVDDTESNYLVAKVNGTGDAIATKTIASGTGAYTLAFGAQGTNNRNWQAIPEPTSGLLLLLGVAGLALKRKRA